VVITTGRCFILALHKGEGVCRVRLQRITSCNTSLTTAGSTVSVSQASSQVSDDGDSSVVIVPQRSRNPEADAAAGEPVPALQLSGRLFKRSSVLGRVSWTLQLMSLSGSTLSYTNKESKDKTYDLAGCTVSAPQVRSVQAMKL
jgi:hypothetical protein